MPRLGIAIVSKTPESAGSAYAHPTPAFSHAELLNLVQESQRRGLHSFWLTEGVAFDALVRFGALAPHCEGIKLGTGIVNIYSRTPAALAVAAATLDDISGGRFILGLGTGHRPTIEGVHGVPFENPVERMRDYVTIIRAALTGERTTHKGDAYQVKNLQISMAPPSGRVPIYLATLGLRMARLAGEVADGVILHLVTLDHLRRIKLAIVEGAEAAGRDPAQIEIASFILCNPSRDLGDARKEIARNVARYAFRRPYRNLLRQSGFRPEVAEIQKAWERNDPDTAFAAVSDTMLRSLSVAIGTEDMQYKVDAFRKAGVDLPILFPTVRSDTHTLTFVETLAAIPIDG